MNNLIILCEPRTGSNLLCELMFSFSNLRVLNELFIKTSNKNNAPHQFLLRKFELEYLYQFFNIQDNNVITLTQKLNENHKKSLEYIDKLIPNYKVIKIHKHIFEEYDLSYLFKDQCTQFILLDRTSKIKQFVSHQIANQIAQYIHVNTSDVKVIVNLEEFLSWREKSIKWYEFIEDLLEKHKKNYLKINYESDLEYVNENTLSSRIEDWLSTVGIDSNKKDYKLKFFNRQNFSKLEDQILNFEEIKHYLGK